MLEFLRGQEFGRTHHYVLASVIFVVVLGSVMLALTFLVVRGSGSGRGGTGGRSTGRSGTEAHRGWWRVHRLILSTH